jgi:hypothetical protein
MVAVVAVLPVSGTACEALCALAVHSAAMPVEHGSASACHDPIDDSAAVRDASGHDCGAHSGSAGESPAVVSANRVDGGVIPVAQQIGPSVYRLFAPTPLTAHSQSGTPPGTAPPVRTSLVLRI